MVLSNAELDRLMADGRERLAHMRTILTELAEEEFTGSARSGNAVAVVDSHAGLVDLRIADKALTVRGLDLDALNADILEAIEAARRQAAARARELLRPVFPALMTQER